MPLQHPSFLLLGRPGCDLCEEFEADLRAHFAGQPFELHHADVDSSPAWRTRYGRRIPVLLDADGGELVCETVFDAGAVAWHF